MSSVAVCDPTFGRIFTKVYAQDLFDVWAVRRDGLLVGMPRSSRPTSSQATRSSTLWPGRMGLGLGTEVAEAIVAYGFDTLALTTVHAPVAAPNKASLTCWTESVSNMSETSQRTTAAPPACWPVT
ncbi:GNAT family N-acetyltransferase [Streptomyces sp. B21-106]|uniref:GNAT family N-acetyltransferase n=1 Tax=Streptomyces sp. B21-106 TaxID=3039418 RepID=UPI002FEF6991